jgi:predicted metal-dependent HD superfamily phosphohydrolase
MEFQLEPLFLDLVRRSGGTVAERIQFWDEIRSAHSSKGRHYHTMDHVAYMLARLEPVWAGLEDPDAVLLAICYHDAVYRVTRKDNEERSAGLMRQRMHQLNASADLIRRSEGHILATKAHSATSDPDTAFLTDADLAVLGGTAEEYDGYVHATRKEYRRYPDLLYRPGRRKVLQHFLAMPSIYRTFTFQAEFEVAARRDLARELASLG